MEDLNIICLFPDGFEELLNNLYSKRWLLAPFNTDETDFYRPANYLVNKEKDNVRYILIIDRNIFSFIISAYKKEKINEHHRNAISLISFCQFSEIEIDVGLPVHEKVNYDKNNLTEALLELDLFFRIDDTPNTESLIKFALGKCDKFKINKKKDNTHRLASISSWYEKYDKIKNWDSLYLIILKLADLEMQEISSFEKFKIFMDWQYKDFRFSMIGTIYSFILFSSQRIKGMMKYKKYEEMKKNKRNLMNMTWDLFLMDYYSKKLVNKKSNEEFLFASDDKVVRHLLKIILNTNMSGRIETLKDYLLKKEYPMLEYYLLTQERMDEREYLGPYFKIDDHRNKMIMQYEKQLLE